MNNIKLISAATLAAVALSAPFFASANGDEICLPHDSGNQAPLAAIHLQPATLMAGNCQASTRLRLSVSNISVEEATANESLLLDGETNRLELNHVYRLGNIAWLDSVSINIPFYNHSEGFMDGTIESWHDLTGLPEGKRINRPKDQLAYNYSSNGQALVSITDEQSGLGDMVVAVHRERLSIALKLPTGDENKLTGSGGAELGAWWSSPLPQIGKSGFSMGAGATYIHDDKVISGRSNSYTGAFAATATYGLTDEFNLLLSGNWQTAWYDSEISTLGDLSGNISIGGYGYLGDGIWSFRLTEDLPTETAPDVGLVFDYTWIM